MTHFNGTPIKPIKYKSFRRLLIGKTLNNILNVVVCKNHNISLDYVYYAKYHFFQFFGIMENCIILNLIKTRYTSKMHDNLCFNLKIVLVQMVLLLNKQLESTYLYYIMHYFCGHVRLFPSNIGLVEIIEN